MKRIVICSTLLTICLSLSIYSAVRVTSVAEEMGAQLDAIELSLDANDQPGLVARIGELERYWSQEELELVHYIRHNNIDSISVSVSRLSPLAKRGDFPELGAELRNIRWQMEHVRSSEMVTLHNLL